MINLSHIRRTITGTDKRYCVYMITTPSGFKYIGRTWHPRRRIRQHLNLNSSSNPTLKYELFKYGKENITANIIHDNLTKSQASKLEHLEMSKIEDGKLMNVIIKTNSEQ